MKTLFKNPAHLFAMLLLAAAMAFAATDPDYSAALQTHFAKGTLGSPGKTRSIEMFFQNVFKSGKVYSVSGKSKTSAAEDAFSGTLTVSGVVAGGSCGSGETEIKGSYNLNEKESKTSGYFAGSFTVCEKGGKLSKASFKGDWVKHATGSKTPCSFEFSGGSVKLLDRIIYESGSYQRFEYDDKNRIVKIMTNEKTTTLAYKGDDLVSIQGLNLKKNGNTITIGEEIITIDNDGYIVKKGYSGSSSVSSYQYKAGNLMRIDDIGSRHEYKYDDKKSPFFNCKTPKWFLINELHFGLKNNIVESSYIVNTEGVMDQYIYDFEYDSEGYPTKSTTSDMGEEITKRFKYK